jgi:hypothetical protein
MPQRNELVIRASAVGLDPTGASYVANDSKLEQKVLWLEKRGTTFAGTLASGTMTNDGTQSTSGDTVVVGAITYTYVTALTETAASTTLTIGSEPSDGDIVSIGGYAYTFRTALTNGGTAPGEVLIGGSASASCTNLGYAIANTGGTAGTNYGLGNTANPLVTVGTVTSSTVALTASVSLTNATQGNQIQTAVPVGTAETFTGAFMAGGVNAVPYQILLGASVLAQMTNTKDAINATSVGTLCSTGTVTNAQVTATSGSTTVVVTAVDYTVTNASIPTTVPINTGTVNSWGATTLTGGVKKQIAVNTTTYDGANGVSGDANPTDTNG